MHTIYIYIYVSFSPRARAGQREHHGGRDLRRWRADKPGDNPANKLKQKKQNIRHISISLNKKTKTYIYLRSR